MKDQILDTIDDLVTDFTFYDRKEDEELSRDALLRAVAMGDITIDEMVNKFRSELEKVFK